MSILRIVLTGGGSGGHLYPLLAVADALRELGEEEERDLELFYLGPRSDYADLFRSRDIRIQFIASGKLRRYFSLLNVLDVPRFFIGFFQALCSMLRLMPDVVFSKGGTGAPVAVCLVAWLYRIPVVIHESDATPGLGNAIVSRFAKKILVSFQSAAEYFVSSRALFTGTPVRPELFASRTSQIDAKRALGFDHTRPLLFILGGSQGAERVSERVVEALPELVKFTQVLHQTGRALYREVSELAHLSLESLPEAERRTVNYQAVPYLEDNLGTALSAADLVLSRAGSGTLFELAAFGKPAVLVPLPESANDHQRKNAYEFSKTGAAMVIEEKNFLPTIVVTQIRELLGDSSRLRKMSEASAAFYKPTAAQMIAQEILHAINSH
jgi:UDP-N-acetylglucosamine--N-acetylmuramyl-(pentapeptide) pyrophosphoryl-undecaprenol N-acetylglucosamine transferase